MMMLFLHLRYNNWLIVIHLPLVVPGIVRHVFSLPFVIVFVSFVECMYLIFPFKISTLSLLGWHLGKRVTYTVDRV